MVDFEIKDCYKFDDLLRIMEILRAPDGCMWDREQDHHSIRRNFIEETYEVCEAIDDEDTEHMKEELGDVLLQVVFHTQMEKEKGTFDIDDVADGICKKLIFRHPHIFGNVEVASSEEVLRNWDDLKRKEKHQETDTQALESVAKSLPSLIRAEKLQKKAAKVGFDWDNVKDALDKVQEELDEVRRAIDGDGDPEEEIGDLLFASVNVARHLKIDPEAAAEKTCNKFVSRFAEMERQATAAGKKLADLSLSELDALNKELANKGGALIGVNTFTLDGDEAAISEAKDVLAKKGATYQNVYFDSDGEAGKFTTNIFAYPTTYVVDRSGNIVGEPIVGAITEKKQAETLQKLIEQALAADVG